MIYYLIFCFLAIGAIFDVLTFNKAVSWFFVITSSLILILFAGLRYEVGFDFNNYLILYTDVVNGGFAFIEPIVAALMKFSDATGIGYAGFILLMAFLSIPIKTHFILKYSTIPVLSVLLFYSRLFIISDFGQIRQGLALGIILLSYPNLHRQELSKFSLKIVLAMLIHFTAFIFFPIYFIARKRINPKVQVAVLFIGFIIASVDLKLILISLFSKILPGGIAEKLLFYSETEDFLGLTFSIFLRGGIVLICLIYYRQKILENKHYEYVYNIYFWGFIFYLVFNSLPQLGGRGAFYFQQFEILLFPILILVSKSKIVRVAWLLFFIFYCFWGLSTVLNSQDAFFPYNFSL